MLSICSDAVVPCEPHSDLLVVVLRVYKHQGEPQRQIGVDQVPALFREAVTQILAAAPYEQAILHLRDQGGLVGSWATRLPLSPPC